MKTFRNKDFEDYIKTLKVSFSCGNTYLIDPNSGEVCTVNVNDATGEVADYCTIDGYEFRFNEKQKQQLFNMAYDEGEENLRQWAEYLLDREDEERHRRHLDIYYR